LIRAPVAARCDIVATDLHSIVARHLLLGAA
jgi:hypothetical protein